MPNPPPCLCASSCDASRREFIKRGAGTVSAGVAYAMGSTGAVAADAKAAPAPVVDVAPVDALKEHGTLAFNYPDVNSPALLLRLPQAAPGGVGPGSSIVAFSSLCTHKGCPVSYRAQHKLLVCPCHWSTFDPGKKGQLVVGQASQALPQIELRLKDKMVQAVGIQGLIYGRHTNIV